MKTLRTLMIAGLALVAGGLLSPQLATAGHHHHHRHHPHHHHGVGHHHVSTYYTVYYRTCVHAPWTVYSTFASPVEASRSVTQLQRGYGYESYVSIWQQ